jgi:hypothetical protein
MVDGLRGPTLENTPKEQAHIDAIVARDQALLAKRGGFCDAGYQTEALEDMFLQLCHTS